MFNYWRIGLFENYFKIISYIFSHYCLQYTPLLPIYSSVKSIVIFVLHLPRTEALFLNEITPWKPDNRHMVQDQEHKVDLVEKTMIVIHFFFILELNNHANI